MVGWGGEKASPTHARALSYRLVRLVGGCGGKDKHKTYVVLGTVLLIIRSGYINDIVNLPSSEWRMKSLLGLTRPACSLLFTRALPYRPSGLSIGLYARAHPQNTLEWFERTGAHAQSTTPATLKALWHSLK